ncbi:Replication factor A protein 1 [Clydaea vesicula]|uniref:Replication protein A subunit n=1 Tax=Clydaea vesicula TaxID=447962 RepID=A0AAD5XYT6_9FUNG|nr:Replication factor A protein 1 [Clydaea vesicula]
MGSNNTNTNLLTQGFVNAIYNNEAKSYSKPVVQLVRIKKIPNKPVKMLISDGVETTVAMMVNNFSEMQDEPQESAVLRIESFVINSVQDSNLLVILSMTILQAQAEKIGNPTPHFRSAGQDRNGNNEAFANQKMKNTNSMNSGQFGGSNMGNLNDTNNGQRSVGGVMKNNGNTNNMRPGNGNQNQFMQRNQSTNFNNSNQPLRGVSSGANVGVPIFPIKSLSPYQNKWTIRARVLQKSEMRSWKNARGEGKLFSLTFKDETGEIRATAFNDAATQFFDLLQENQVTLSINDLVLSDNSSSVDNEYEMSLDASTTITLCTDGTNASVPGVEYNRVLLGELGNYEKDTVIDIIAVVKSFGDSQTLISKAQKEYVRRDLVLVDESNYSVRFTLFGKQAEQYNGNEQNQVIAVKGVKVNDFGGRSLTMDFNGSIQSNPDLTIAHKLRGWFDSEVNEHTNFQTYSGDIGSGGGKTVESKVISQITDENLGSKDKPDYFQVHGTISFVKMENISYTACQSDGCNKKVTEDHSGWRCEKCDKSWPEPDYRYTLNVSVMDHTGNCWVSIFNELGCQLVGKTANEMVQLKDHNEAEYQAILSKLIFQSFTMKLRAKQENWQDEVKVKLTMAGVSPINYEAENKRLLSLISRY